MLDDRMLDLGKNKCSEIDSVTLVGQETHKVSDVTKSRENQSLVFCFLSLETIKNGVLAPAAPKTSSPSP